MNDTTDLIAWMRRQTGVDKTRAELARREWNDLDPWVELDSDVRRHCQTWDPARVLAEVEAKRRIIDAYETALTAASNDIGGGDRTVFTDAAVWGDAVKLLATAYADRDGYRADAWKPWEPEL